MEYLRLSSRLRCWEIVLYLIRGPILRRIVQFLETYLLFEVSQKPLGISGFRFVIPFNLSCVCLEIEVNTYYSPIKISSILERKRFYNKAGIEEDEGEQNNYCSKHCFCNCRTMTLWNSQVETIKPGTFPIIWQYSEPNKYYSRSFSAILLETCPYFKPAINLAAVLQLSAREKSRASEKELPQKEKNRVSKKKVAPEKKNSRQR